MPPERPTNELEKSRTQLVYIPGTEKRIMSSDGREYHIFISAPLQPAPPDGFPIIYLLDANSVFGTMTEAIRAQSRFPERTGVEPAIVVGIGYATDAPFHPARHFDYTHPLPESELPPHPDGQAWPEQGGSADFLRFIEKELKPRMERELPVNTGRQSIFGHSLGGLFVLTVLFTKPYSFQNYIAGSPSIYWNERILLEKEGSLEERLTGDKPVRLLLAIGEWENGTGSFDDRRTEAMAARLSPLDPRLTVEFKEFKDESHISVLPVLISQGIRFALKNPL